VKFSKPQDTYFSDLGKGTTTTDTDAGSDGFTGVITLASGENNTSIDAGYNKLGSIGDFLWLDTNANGLQDAGEVGFGGQLVELFDEKFTTLLATTTTDANGAYNFSGLKAGKYGVRFNKPIDYVFTDRNVGGNDGTDSDADTSTGGNSGRSAVITVNSDQAVTTVDAGIFKNASLGDRVWNDANSNGIQDATEVGIANVAVSLWADGTTQVGTTTTNASGLYSFTNLRPGTYQVRVATPTGFTVTTRGTNPTSDTDSNIDATGRTGLITLSSGETNNTIDAGYTLGGGSLPGGGSDLQITKSDGLTSVVAGQRITYTIDVKNVGSTAVSNAVVTDVMPANLSNVSWTSAVLTGTVTGHDASGTGNINDTITSLGANSSVRYTVNATVLKPITSSTITNTATVTGPIGFVDSNTTNNSATDVDTILRAPGSRTPGFWVNKCWKTFWDGIAGNEPSQAGTTYFANGDLFLAPYTNSQQPGKVMDNVTGTYQAGVLIGDWNRNGLTDNGEQTIFYTTAEALKVMDSSQQPDKSDVRYTLARSLVASWLNHLAGNPVDTAATNDVDARLLINRGITWLQTYTPDENTPKDGKGDGMLSKLSTLSSPYMKASNTAWTTANTGGKAINTGLDNYNNGRGGLADGLLYGGNA
jgi:uncharacterized repeat protein (TIGR01451 family)